MWLCPSQGTKKDAKKEQHDSGEDVKQVIDDPGHPEPAVVAAARSLGHAMRRIDALAKAPSDVTADAAREVAASFTAAHADFILETAMELGHLSDPTDLMDDEGCSRDTAPDWVKQHAVFRYSSGVLYYEGGGSVKLKGLTFKDLKLQFSGKTGVEVDTCKFVNCELKLEDCRGVYVHNTEFDNSQQACVGVNMNGHTEFVLLRDVKISGARRASPGGKVDGIKCQSRQKDTSSSVTHLALVNVESHGNDADGFDSYCPRIHCLSFRGCKFYDNQICGTEVKCGLNAIEHGSSDKTRKELLDARRDLLRRHPNQSYLFEYIVSYQNQFSELGEAAINAQINPDKTWVGEGPSANLYAKSLFVDNELPTGDQVGSKYNAKFADQHTNDGGEGCRFEGVFVVPQEGTRIESLKLSAGVEVLE